MSDEPAPVENAPEEEEQDEEEEEDESEEEESPEREQEQQQRPNLKRRLPDDERNQIKTKIRRLGNNEVRLWKEKFLAEVAIRSVRMNDGSLKLNWRYSRIGTTIMLGNLDRFRLLTVQYNEMCDAHQRLLQREHDEINDDSSSGSDIQFIGIVQPLVRPDVPVEANVEEDAAPNFIPPADFDAEAYYEPNDLNIPFFVPQNNEVEGDDPIPDDPFLPRADGFPDYDLEDAGMPIPYQGPQMDYHPDDQYPDPLMDYPDPQMLYREQQLQNQEEQLQHQAEQVQYQEQQVQNRGPEIVELGDNDDDDIQVIAEYRNPNAFVIEPDGDINEGAELEQSLANITMLRLETDEMRRAKAELLRLGSTLQFMWQHRDALGLRFPNDDTEHGVLRQRLEHTIIEDIDDDSVRGEQGELDPQIEQMAPSEEKINRISDSLDSIEAERSSLKRRLE